MNIELRSNAMNRDAATMPVKIGSRFDDAFESTRIFGKNPMETRRLKAVSGDDLANPATGGLKRNDQIVRAGTKPGRAPDATVMKSSAI